MYPEPLRPEVLLVSSGEGGGPHKEAYFLNWYARNGVSVDVNMKLSCTHAAANVCCGAVWLQFDCCPDPCPP